MTGEEARSEAALLEAFERAGITLGEDPGSALIGPRALDVLPLETPAFVITAENPGGERAPDEDNDRWTEELEAILRERGVDPHNVVAGGGSWRERGYLVAATQLPLADVLTLAARFGQHSVFRLTEESVEIIRVADAETISSRPRRFGGPSAAGHR